MPPSQAFVRPVLSAGSAPSAGSALSAGPVAAAVLAAFGGRPPADLDPSDSAFAVDQGAPARSTDDAPPAAGARAPRAAGAPGPRGDHGPGSDPGERLWLRIVLVAAPLAAIGVGFVAVAFSLVGTIAQLLVAIVVPLVAIALLALGNRPAPRFAAAIALDIETILAAAINPAGIAFALALPLISVGLVQSTLRGRALTAAFALSSVTAVVGTAAAVFVGPISGSLQTSMLSGVLTVISFAAVSAFALALNWRATGVLYATVAATEAEIARRDAAERRERDLSEMLDAIVRSSPVATQAFDLDRRILLWSPASERIFGWTAEETVGRPLPIEMIPLEDRQESRARIDRTLAGRQVTGDRVRRLTKSGEERWIDMYAGPLLDRDGIAIGVAGQLVDVTERVRLEAELAYAQRMGAVGLLAAGIAHDFNNTLTAAGGYAELILDSSEGTIAADAATIIDVVDRGRQLTRRLLDVARESDSGAEVVDLREVVVGIEPLLRRLIGSVVSIRIELPEQPVEARVHVGQLEQALINLAVNARDAMPSGGVVTVSVGLVDGEGEIAVSDGGGGIPDSVVPHVFEPFYTTKPAGQGTGLGLAMVRGFTDNAAGTVTVESEVGRGSTFRIRLPAIVHDEQAPSVSPAGD